MKLINILIASILLSSTATIVSNGYLMIEEKDNLNFGKLSQINQGIVFCLIYTEIYLSIIILYNILYYLYYCIFSCYNDNEMTIYYNCWRALFLLSGIATHIFLFFIFVTNSFVIDTNVNNINIIFNVNFIFIILSSIGYRIYLCKLKSKYSEIN